MKKTSEKLFYILLPLLFTFPFFKESIVTFIFLLLAANTICYIISSKTYPRGVKKIFLFTIPFWIVLINCLCFFKDFPKDILPITNASLFLFFPLVFYYIPTIHFTQEKINFYLEILKNVCLIMAVGYIASFLYYHDFSDFFVFRYGIPKFRDFVYYEVTFFKIHPTYYTAMVILCFAHSLDKVFKHKKYLELFYLASFILITFLLLVKINIVFLTLLLLGMLLFRSPFSLNQKITSCILMLITFAIMSMTIPGIKNRFAEMYDNYDKAPVGLSYSSTNVRVSIYKCCLEIGKRDGLWGVGFSNLGDELLACYKENYRSSFYIKNGYLSHNYFFYIFLSSGVIGFLIFLFYIYNVAVEVMRIKIFVLTVGLINIFAICFSEDFLYRQFGLFYFSLLFFTFYNYRRRKKEENTQRG